MKASSGSGLCPRCSNTRAPESLTSSRRRRRGDGAGSTIHDSDPGRELQPVVGVADVRGHAVVQRDVGAVAFELHVAPSDQLAAQAVARRIDDAALYW